MNKNIRVRFAPSPTGGLHIGGLRTALFNYLFAKKNGGTFILRIEDTDQNRFVEGAEEYIIECLRWAGIMPDEGQGVGGDYGPYRQSERKEIYKQYAALLVDSGNAYYAFDTEDELEAMRERLKAQKVAAPQYNAVTRMQMTNSLTLPAEEVTERLNSGQPYVIRLKTPRKDEIRFEDVVRGWVVFQSAQVDDKVLLKSDGMPTYHLANVVDDHLMEISHVIRGEEWLPSTPVHILLYKAFGWEHPQFAHLPLVLKPDGDGKLSKRDAEKHGFPIFPLAWQADDESKPMLGYREYGYYSDALVNFLALLGWNPGNNREIFSLSELVEAFTLERIGKAGVKFDINKAKWFNQHYLRERPQQGLIDNLALQLKLEKINFDEKHLNTLIELVKERAVFEKDMIDEARLILVPPATYDADLVSKKITPEAIEFIEKLSVEFGKIKTDLVADEVKPLIEEVANQLGLKSGKMMQPLRIALTGAGGGPDLTTIITILGVTEVSERLKKAVVAFKA